MTPLQKRLLASVPATWTDLGAVQAALPAPAPSLDVFEFLERAGLIEVRQQGQPAKIQVRRAQDAAVAAPVAPAKRKRKGKPCP